MTLLSLEMLSEVETVFFIIAAIVYIFMARKIFISGKQMEEYQEKLKESNKKIEELKTLLTSSYLLK